MNDTGEKKLSGLICAEAPDSGELILLRYEDIVAVTTADRQVMISTNIRDYLYKGSFSVITELLCSTGYFLKCNRNTLVNLRWVIRLEHWSNMRIILHIQSYNKARIVLSRQYLKDFKRMVGLP